MSSEEDSSVEISMQDQTLKGCKVKRTRQRVDAGEPRNSYASIANFSASRGGYHSSHSYHSPTFNGLSISPNNKFIGELINNNKSPVESVKSEMIVLEDSLPQMCVNGTLGAGQIAPPYINGGSGVAISSAAQTNAGKTTVGSNNNGHQTVDVDFNKNKSGVNYLSAKSGTTSSEVTATGAHLLRDILQTGRKLESSIVDSDQPNASGNHKVGGRSQCSDASEMDDDDLEEDLVEASRDAESMEQDNIGEDSSPSEIDQEPKSSRSSSPSKDDSQTNNSNNDNLKANNSIEVKRARVENIVSNMLLGGNGNLQSSSAGKSSDNLSMPVNGCKKRKLYQPQQSKSNGPVDNDDEFEEAEEDEEAADEEDEVSELDLSKGTKTGVKDNLRRQLEDMQAQLVAMRQRYVQLFEQQQQQAEAAAANISQLGPVNMSPVNLTTSTSPADECDTELDDMTSEKGPASLISHLSELNSRETPANVSAGHGLVGSSAAATSNINDPAQFLDEARRLISEQENMTSKSNRQSSGHRPIGQSAFGSLNSQLTIQPSLADLEWLIESLKSEIHAFIVHIIDSTFAKFLQRKASQQKANLDQTESSKELTLLSQMLDRKSPRKVIDRGAAAASFGNPIKDLNGQSNRASPISCSLPTETAQAPKPTPFPFTHPNFKSPFFIPNVAATGAQIPHQQALIPTASALAQHFNTLASTLSQVNQNRQEQLAMSFRDNSSVRESGLNSSNGHGHGHISNGSHIFNRSDESLPEQTEAMSLVIPQKRKRHKVTDTRITPRTVSRLLGQEQILSGRDSSPVSPTGPINYHGPPPPPPLVPVSLPTSVAIPNPSLHQADLFSGSNFPFGEHPRLSLFGDLKDDSDLREVKNHNVHHAVASAVAAHHLQMLAASRSSPDSLHGFSGSALHYNRVGSENGADGSETNETQVYDSNMPMTSTLTPMHLRKAKLMFFFVRYPSSAILKMFFPDIKFNKNNTAQLVKWFSNFREFYYIQMEKYARQALSEGVKNAEEIHVSTDAELLRVLNLHYNRNNHIDVPENFRYVSEQTLREFFKAIQAGKDTEQSWKKAIYKIIARLDDNVPEYFKSPNFLEQLE